MTGDLGIFKKCRQEGFQFLQPPDRMKDVYAFTLRLYLLFAHV